MEKLHKGDRMSIKAKSTAKSNLNGKFNILITGGVWYLGSVLSEPLVGLGHNVTIVDNLYYKQSPMLNLCSKPNFDFVIGDARNPELMAKILQGKDFIIP